MLSILGVVLAVFIPTFASRVRTSKIVEASEVLEELSRKTASYYAATWDRHRQRCLPPAAGPTPSNPTVDPVTVDFSEPDTQGAPTWDALGFQPDRPLRYSYSFLPAQSGCSLEDGDETLVVFRAEGDLDGDGVRSTFERRAIAGDDGVLRPVGELHIQRRVE